jgi:precorrin-3B synthase
MPYVAATVRGVVAARLEGPAGAVRGACPSVHEPFVALDGALARVRLPGGGLTAAAARAVARIATRPGAIEITNRANLQVRGIDPHAVGQVVDALVDAGLVLPDARADERRNVLTSPTAGFDPAELVDPRGLVADVATILASDAARGVSPKFGVLVDGGGVTHVRGRAHDVALGAVRTVDGVAYEVALAAALPVGARTDDVVLVDPENALDLVARIVRLGTPYGRVRDWLAARGVRAAHEELALRAVRAEQLAPPPAPAKAPVGVLPQRDPDVVAVGCVPLLGRLDGTTLAALASIAESRGNGELRCTPWRGIVLAGVARHDVREVVAACEGLGLACHTDDPATIVVACAGSRGCASGLTDAQADGAQLVAELARVAPDRRPALVLVSG